MGKSRRSSVAHLSYNRPSKGYQTNLAKKYMKDADMPKRKDTKKLMRNLKIILAVWLVGVAVDTYIEGFSGFVGMLVLGVIIAAIILMYINKLDKDVIRAYKNLEIPKETYLEEARRQGMDGRKLKRLGKLWDKTKEKKHEKAHRQQAKQSKQG